MRRVRYLTMPDYAVPIGQKTNQIFTLSGGCVLEKVWNRQSEMPYELKIHAKFNASTINGLQILAFVEKGGVATASLVEEVNVYSINSSSWSESLVYSGAPSEVSPYLFSLSVTQANLGANELSGKEVYAIEVFAVRRRRKFYKKIYFNHLGIFDSLFRLKQESDFIKLTKVDE